MPVARITKQGTTVIAFLVALLWGCFIGERVLVRQANREYYRAIRDVQLLQLKRHAEPVSAPRRAPLQLTRPILG